jgi:hypothetical protein
MQIELERIRFNREEIKLNDMQSLKWNDQETRIVEFFPNRETFVTLIEIDDENLQQILNSLTNDSPLVIDFEWRAFRRDSHICLYQICSEYGVYVIRDREAERPSWLMQRFLSSLSGRSFVGKGIANDLKKLRARYGTTFNINLEDVEQTRLRPYGLSCNFDQMTLRFAGRPKAQFKNKRISTSDWLRESLTIQQVLYAAFDVFALFVAWPNFPLQSSLESMNSLSF